MPEPIVIDPLSTPAPADVAKTGGIDAMMAQLDAADVQAAVVEVPAVVPDKPTEPKEPVVPEPEPEPQPELEPAKPAAKPADAEMSVEDMEKFLKAHPNKKPWKIYESLKTTTAGKVADLESKLKAIEGKAVASPGDAEKVAALEKRIEVLTGETSTYKQRLAAADFRHTPQFAALRERGGRLLSKGHQLISGMKVVDADGTERAATKEDCDFLRAVPASRRGEVAKAMLGDFNAFQIASLASQIDDVREESDIGADEFARNDESNRAQQEQTSKSERAKFDGAVKAGMDRIKSDPKRGKWFTPDAADPEAAKMLNDGYEAVERLINGSNHLPAETVAETAAVLRAQAAAFPRVLLEVNRLQAKTAALEAELVKFRGTDPGAKGATAGGGPVATPKRGGIDEQALAFDSDPSLVNGRR